MNKLKIVLGGAALSLGLAGAALAAPDGGAGGGQGRKAEMLKKYDTNHDGKLDDKERAPLKAERQAHRAERKAKRLAQFDANKNGKLDDAERQAMHAQRKAEKFKKLDVNNDGKITPDEFAAAKAHGGKHGGKHGKHGGSRRP